MIETQPRLPDTVELYRAQKAFFDGGATRPVAFRLAQLKKLKEAIASREAAILDALRRDLGKPEFEAYGSELGFVYEELRFIEKRLHRWAAPRRVSTPILQWPASSRIHPEPKGVVLVISPWNYPFQLLISPAVGAIAAGNCVLLKPSELAPHTSRVVAELVSSTFPPEFLACVEGAVEVTQRLLDLPFDHVFFTGSTAVGKVIMAAAAKHLTPVTLELGGKSPCIVDDTVPVEVTGRRIAWGKFFNAGQTCVAPDYLLVPRRLKQPLCEAIQDAIVQFFGDDPAASPDYARIVNDRHFKRLEGLMQGARVITGGKTRATDRYIAPTLLESPGWDAPVMKEEIFGPLLPVVEYDSLDDAIDRVKGLPRPLALYVFSASEESQEKVVSRLSFGGGCVNDTLMHLANPNLPFGGIGPSGLGHYHGKYSFDTFSHFKSVLKRPFYLDLKLRYQPYLDRVKLVRRLIGP